MFKYRIEIFVSEVITVRNRIIKTDNSFTKLDKL